MVESEKKIVVTVIQKDPRWGTAWLNVSSVNLIPNNSPLFQMPVDKIVRAVIVPIKNIVINTPNGGG